MYLNNRNHEKIVFCDFLFFRVQGHEKMSNMHRNPHTIDNSFRPRIIASEHIIPKSSSLSFQVNVHGAPIVVCSNINNNSTSEASSFSINANNLALSGKQLAYSTDGATANLYNFKNLGRAKRYLLKRERAVSNTPAHESTHGHCNADSSSSSKIITPAQSALHPISAHISSSGFC